MRSNLPPLPRRRSRLRHGSLALVAGAGTVQLAVSATLAITARTTANSVPDAPGARTAVMLTVLAVAAFAMLYGAQAVYGVVRGRKLAHRSHPSTGGRLRNQWTRGLSRRFRRG